MICILSLPVPAWADWVKIVQHKRGNVFYIDPSSIQVVGGKRTVTELIDYKRPDIEGDRSVRVLREYDCEGARYQVLSASYYKDQMASGDVSTSAPGTMGWTDIDVNTPAKAILDHVCALH
jgi:hypothetical protein